MFQLIWKWLLVKLWDSSDPLRSVLLAHHDLHPAQVSSKPDFLALASIEDRNINFLVL